MPVLFYPSKQKKRKMNKLMRLQILMLIMIQISSENSVNSHPLAPALYVFGDSLFETGNNNLLPTLARADFSPYGMNFDGGPTGRFTNGRTIVDFIAEFLGLPYSTPYMSLVNRILQAEQLTGLNFASAACGILPETGIHLGKCLTFGEQIDLFESIVEAELPNHFKNSDELSSYLSKSIFVISIGGNDYLNNYLKTKRYCASKHYSPQSFASLLIDNLSQQFQRLYRLGARKVIMFEMGPIGCIPSSTRQFKHNGTCVEEINQLVVMFNNKLAPLLHSLTSTLQDSSFILGHVYCRGYDAVINPFKYGLTDSSNPCCVTWFNGTSACIPESWALTCQHPEKYYFWDGFHPTETVYKTIATLCFNGSSVCIPKNIKELTLYV